MISLDKLSFLIYNKYIVLKKQMSFRKKWIDFMLDVLLEAILDTVKLLPFLFITYLLLEWIEHHAAEKTAVIAAKAGNFGPVVGGFLGAVPQCGFSASAANLYAGGIISVGTLISIFISTSDEMLPIMISEKIAFPRILAILAIKVGVGVIIGFVADFLIRFKKTPHRHESISHICEEENCHCEEKGILRSSLLHTVQIAFFIFLFSLVIGTAIYFIGEEQLAAFASNAGIFTPLVAGLVGLIPNCASSVILTELFLSGIISSGALLAGLIANSGVGLLILFRVNRNIRENILITAIIYGCGILIGILFDLIGIVL